MQRDMDLFRSILLAVEEQPTGQIWKTTPLLGHSIRDVVAHVRLIEDAGLIEARFLSPVDDNEAFILRITNDGYDFLAASKETSLWEKAKQKIKSAGVPLTVFALKQALELLIKERLGH